VLLVERGEIGAGLKLLGTAFADLSHRIQSR
jgi:hypothetical protein